MADARLKHAANWLARFTVNGVPASDFFDVLGTLTRWEDWCAAWSARAASVARIGAPSTVHNATRQEREIRDSACKISRPPRMSRRMRCRRNVRRGCDASIRATFTECLLRVQAV